MTRTRIQQLSPSVVNKIAAGEVIERAASVVKELMENAVDAGATRIDVAVEAGGSQLVRVSDNGCGIPPEELTLAVASHATSKIRDADDLFRVGTLGFRGEALASIAEVSRLTLRSRATGTEMGAELEVVAGKTVGVSPCGMPQGTAIEVRELFFNTPVRRKFLKSVPTEMGHVTEAFTRIALAQPQIHFTLRHGGRTLHDLPPCDALAPRIREFFGQELADNLIWVESQEGELRLFGYVAHPGQSRSHPRMQYLFLNGRHIRDRALQHALSEAYRGLLLTGRFPISFLQFAMPPDQVDVNVHPTKLEVRFQDSGRLYSQLLGTLRSKFLRTDLTTRLDPKQPAPTSSASDEELAARRQELVDWAKSQMAAISPPTSEPTAPNGLAEEPKHQAEFDLSQPRPVRPLLSLVRLEPSPAGPASINTTPPLPGAATAEYRASELAIPAIGEATQPFSAAVGGGTPALQVHNRYLIAETREGVVVIDQHALHERILYERLRERVLAGALETQSLLVPEPIDLSSGEMAIVLEHRELLGRLGLQVEPFGGDTVLVRSYPAMLASFQPAEALRALIERLMVEGKTPDRRDLLDELLHMMACKAAVKAGDRLSPAEIATLLEERHAVQDTHHCPHGRPTELVFTREELDRQFMRI